MADLKPAYLLHGDDQVQFEAWRRRLRARAESEGPATTLEVLRDDRLSPESVADAISMLTLSMGTRYVLADGVKGWKAKDVARVAAALKGLGPETVVVFIAEGKPRKDSQGKWVGPAPAALIKAVQAAGGEARWLQAPKRSGYAAWVRDQGGEIGLDVSADAAALLVELIGEDKNRRLRQLRLLRELEKLACFAPEDGRVERGTVEELCVSTSEKQVYELADAFLEGDEDIAVLLAEEILDREGDGEMMPILYALLRRVRDTRRAWGLNETGVPNKAIAADLGLLDWLAKPIIERARKADGERLERAITDLAALDWDLRGGGDRDSLTALTLTLAGVA